MANFSLKSCVGKEVSIKCCEGVLFYYQVTAKLELSSVTAKSIDMLREEYRTVAKRGAILFFVLTEMAGVNSMYQHSLSAYMAVFTSSLHKAIPHTIISQRLRNVISTLTKSVYGYGCTGECKKV
jgi:dynein heavy chain